MKRATKPPSLCDRSIDEMDALLQAAGLARNPRDKAAGVVASNRREQVAPEELTPRVPIPQQTANGVPLLTIPEWRTSARLKGWLWHGFSTRLGGVSRAYCPEDAAGELNLGFTAADEREAVVRNRRLLVEAVTGNPSTPLASIRQIHSSVVVRINSDDAIRELPWKADGAMTDEPGMLLGVQTADCIPVLVADRKRRVVAAFHAGWRGTAKRIVESGVGRMRLEYGCQPEDLVAAIGPGVGACCYAVGEEVISSFESQFAYAGELFHEVSDSDRVQTKYPMLFLTQCAPGHSPLGPGVHVNLVEANRRQLLDAGLGAKAIQSTGGCTNCQPQLFFSHRASKGHAGRMMSVIGVRAR